MACFVAAAPLAIGGLFLKSLQWPSTAIVVIFFAVVSFLAGLVGLAIQYRTEQTREASEEENRPPPRTHRRRPSKIERPLLDKLVRQLKALRQAADEKHWEPDWNRYQEHLAAADAFLAKNDIPAAFREYCRAMLPLTRALHDRRQKEEVFPPVWDKTR